METFGVFSKWIALYSIVACLGAARAEMVLGSREAVITERGPHHAVYSRFTQYVNGHGNVVTRSNGYVALATGMHYLNDGVWTESKEEIEILPSGYAVARQGQHRVIWAGNANTAGAVDIYSSMDDKRFRSHVLGLAYTDKVTGKGRMFAVLKQEANGFVLGNQVLYPDCFDPADGVVASLRYTYTIAGFEQDLIIHNQLPPPENFGLDGATARLELYTEFVEAPQAAKQTRVLHRETGRLRNRMAEPDLTDDILDFGALRVGTGNAFPTDDPDSTIQTGKSWEIREGRRIMAEKIDYVSMLPFLQRLPPAEAKVQPPSNANNQELLAGRVKLPARPGKVLDGISMEMAKAMPSLKGFVIDYQTIGSTNDFTFRGDTTYYTKGQVNLTGKTVMEGGAVIKCTNGTSVRLKLEGTLDCRAASWLPIIMTAKDDDGVGERISESTGNPSSTNGYFIQLTGNTNLIELHDVRMRYAYRGVDMASGCELTLSHAQISRSFAGVVNGAGKARLRNVLIHDTEFATAANGTTSGEHVTFHNVNNLRSSGTPALTNCLIIAVTNNLVYTGSPNGSNTTDSGVFNTLGAGARYLASSSSYRNQGTTNISTNLLADLKQRTTYAPELLSGTTIIYYSNLTQRVARDNDGLPDYGYHYDPIDWCVGNVSVTNCVLNVEPGVVVAAFTNKGIILQQWGRLLCSGTATQLTVLTRYNMVQEEANTNWMATTTNYSTVSVESGHMNTSFDATFTKFTLPSGSGRHFYTGATNDVATLKHCQIFGGEIPFEQGWSLSLVNNLFVRSSTRLQHPGTNFWASWRNNTFVGGRAHWECLSNPVAQVYVDYNVFDGTALVQSNAVTAMSNAYYPSNAPALTNLALWTNYIFTSPIVYEKGDLGDFYLPTNIVDFGPNPADQIGFYHFTTQKSNVREQQSALDIGFHYIALTNGAPFDTDGDGEPDYLENPSGTGQQGWDERNWLVHDRDSDYDGRTDVQETNEMTSATDPLSVTHVLLGRWRFNTNTWVGEQGQLPTWTNDVQPLATWHGNAVSVGTSLQWAGLRFREVETIGTNASYNFNLRSGTIRFWLRPNWSSTNPVGGEVPVNAALFSVGYPTSDGSSGQWTLGFVGTNGHMTFLAQSNGINVYYIPPRQEHRASLVAGRWYQFALTYSPSNIALYTNGQLFATSHSLDSRPGVANTPIAFQHQGHGIAYWPPANVRRAGFWVGNHGGGFGPANGAFEELEIYNYPMTAQEIARGFPKFDGASGVTTDSDYDGRSDLLEQYVDGTSTNNPSSMASNRLGYFRFNDPSTLMGEQGQAPIYTNVVTPLDPGWSGDPLYITTDPGRAVIYRDVETNGWSSFNATRGAVRFWFKPVVSTAGKFLYMGTDNSYWSFQRDQIASTISLITKSNGVFETVLSATASLTNGYWYQLALNYTQTNAELFVNGSLIASNTSSGVTRWPSVSDRTNGLVVGNQTGLGYPMAGYMDELETFNYPLTSAEIRRQYDTVVSQDRDLNGIPDLLEDAVLPAPRPFTGVPFAITGAIEAEQFDLGGKGVAYSNSVANVWTNDYRPSAMEITNCNDLGLGYCVNNLRANDWLKYTIDVRVAQDYVVEARMAALVTNGGAFTVSFTNYDGSVTSTPPILIASTNWHEAAYRGIRLRYGTNIMTITIVSNAPGTNVAGKFNYISLYPSFSPGVPNIVTTNPVTGLTNAETWLAASNNAWQIQKAINDLPTNGSGGAITIPSGRWFIAQEYPNETNGQGYRVNSAVHVTRSNTEIRGEGRTNTTLITWFRSTTAFVLGVNTNFESNPKIIAVTNFTLRDLSIEGRPHNRSTNNGDGTFAPVWEAGCLWPAISDLGSFVTVASPVFPETGTNFTQNLLFTNCLFRNPAEYSIECQYWWSNCLITGCDFIFRDTTFNPTNGIWPFPRTVTFTNMMTSNFPSGQVGIMTRSGYNTLVVSNSFQGNAAITSVNTNFYADVADGIFWGQVGGNWFIAGNVISNYGLEGVAFHGGPAVAVRNTFKTYVSQSATLALNSVARHYSVNGTTNDPQDFSMYFVGNSVDGGRAGSGGVQGFFPNHLHVTGNSFSLLPAFQRYDDVPSPAAAVMTMAFGNISGNTLLTGEYGIFWFDNCTNTLVLKNNFGAATGRALDHQAASGSARSFQILKNVLNQGKSYHLKLAYPDSSFFFLQKNVYTNGLSNVDPFLDAAASPVHIMR